MPRDTRRRGFAAAAKAEAECKEEVKKLLLLGKQKSFVKEAHSMYSERLPANLRLAIARLARDRWSLGSAAELDPRTLVGDGGAVERPRSRVAHLTVVGGEKLVVRKRRRRRRGEDKVETFA